MSLAPSETIISSSKWASRLRSALWSAAICIPLLLWGSYSSMALAHSGGPFVLLVAPIFPVLLLFGSGGPFAPIPSWLFSALAFASQFIGTFVLVHYFRSWQAQRREQNGA